MAVSFLTSTSRLESLETNLIFFVKKKVVSFFAVLATSSFRGRSEDRLEDAASKKRLQNNGHAVQLAFEIFSCLFGIHSSNGSKTAPCLADKTLKRNIRSKNIYLAPRNLEKKLSFVLSVFLLQLSFFNCRFFSTTG